MTTHGILCLADILQLPGRLTGFFHIHPEFPAVVKSNGSRPDTDHTPTIQYDNGNYDNIEHGPGTDTSPALNRPESIDAQSLSCQARHEQVG